MIILFIIIYKPCLPGVARDMLNMSYSFKDFIVILKSLKLKVINHAQTTPIYVSQCIICNLYISNHISKIEIEIDFI